MLKIITIIGARPQFIKAATVSRAFSEHDSGIHELLVHTGQHYDANMSSIFFDELDIPHPEYNLGVGGGTHGENTGRMMEQIEAVLMREKPDWVLVYGDTDSTIAGALAAAKLNIPVAHVEAGLRSFNRKMPEEINRVVTDHVSDLLFAPTDTATFNLYEEGISGEKVQQVGDVMYDAALYYGERARAKSQVLDTLGLEPSHYVLATIHRAENTDDPARLKSIFSAFAGSQRTIILPLHPRTRQRLADFDIDIPPTVKSVEPVGYLDMVMLEINAALIATDSGGIQKEAYFHGVPCITLREETEWVELVKAGANRLVGSDQQAIEAELERVDDAQVLDHELYGDGNASSKIANILATKTLRGV